DPGAVGNEFRRILEAIACEQRGNGVAAVCGDDREQPERIDRLSVRGGRGEPRPPQMPLPLHGTAFGAARSPVNGPSGSIGGAPGPSPPTLLAAGSRGGAEAPRGRPAAGSGTASRRQGRSRRCAGSSPTAPR